MNDEYAQDLPYFDTGKSDPSRWIDRAKKEIEKAGGEVLADAFGAQKVDGKIKAAYMLQFTFGEDRFRVLWPVLEGKYTSNDRDHKFLSKAKRQAATMLFHDVKAACVKARVMGARTAFFAHLELKDGQPITQLQPERVPKLLGGAT